MLRKNDSKDIPNDELLKRHWYKYLINHKDLHYIVFRNDDYFPVPSKDLIHVSYNAFGIKELHCEVFFGVPAKEIEQKLRKGKHVEVFSRIFNLKSVLRNKKLLQQLNSCITINGISCLIMVNKLFEKPPCSNDQCDKQSFIWMIYKESRKFGHLCSKWRISESCQVDCFLTE